MATLTSDGEYVDVYEGRVDEMAAGWMAGRNVWLEKFDATMELVETLRGDLTEALNELETLTRVDLPDNWEDILRDVVIDDVVSITRDGLPATPTLSLPDDWPTDVPILGALKEVPNVDTNFTTPTVPDEPDPTLNWTASSYVSEVWDALFDKVYDGIVNGGTGLDEDVEDAIFERARERQRIINAREYDRAIDAVSSDGFDFAGGAQASILGASIAELAQQDENLNRDVMIKQAELAQVNTHFMLDKGLALEQLLRQFYSDNENRSLDAQKAIADFVLRKYSEKIKAYIAQWEGVKLELEAKMATVEVVLKQNEMILRKFEGEMTGHTAEVDLIAKKIDALVNGYRGEVEGFKAIVDREAAWWRALTEEQRAKIEKNRLELEQAVQEIRALVESTVALNGLREKIAEAVANITAQVLASALAAVHASISHGTSSSSSRQEGWSHSDQLGETHSFDETAT